MLPRVRLSNARLIYFEDFGLPKDLDRILGELITSIHDFQGVTKANNFWDIYFFEWPEDELFSELTSWVATEIIGHVASRNDREVGVYDLDSGEVYQWESPEVVNQNNFLVLTEQFRAQLPSDTATTWRIRFVEYPQRYLFEAFRA